MKAHLAHRRSRGLVQALYGLLLPVLLFFGCNNPSAGSEEASKSTPEAWEEAFLTYRDPATNSMPPRVRARELAYVRTLPGRGGANKHAASLFTWASAGPNNRGGRTRALAVDVEDPLTVMAGSVSGGFWKSTDGGTTWALKTAPGDHLSVTAIAQDPRPGHTATWYHAGGEYRGGTSASDRGFRAPYMGVGVYKSSDNGETWSVLSATTDTDPTRFDAPFDYVHRIVVSPATGTVLVANNGSGILRSDDGGASFSLVLGGLAQHTWSDVAVGSDGILVATLSSQRVNNSVPQAFSPGVYRSTDDGQTWADVTPATYPASHQRSVVRVAPSNATVAYVLTYTGQTSNGREDIRLHKLGLAFGESEDRSANLPLFPALPPSQGDAIVTFNNFCMTMAVKPDDEHFLIVGGTTLYRSRDGFATPASGVLVETRIGGYDGFGGLFGNHYVDQHIIAFHVDHPNEIWTGNDGGVFVTRDVTAPSVSWENKNSGYVVSKFYGLDIPDRAGDKRVMGGAQDDGFLYVENASTDAGGAIPDADKVVIGDGAYCYFGERFAYVSRNVGEIYRLSYGTLGELRRGSESYVGQQTFLTNGRFIPPFAVDPSDERVVYFPLRTTIYRNQNVEALPPTVNNSWGALGATAVPTGYRISALAVSTNNPSHVLYFSGYNFNGVPKVYRMAQANTARSGVQDISIAGVPVGAYVHSLAVNPNDGDEILVAFSNYNITGLFHSTDGGQTYTAVEGNLEGSSATPGPSLRSASILPLTALGSQQTVYLVGTSAGLFSTRSLEGVNTVWVQEASALTGSAVVEYVTSRPSDGRIAIATQGRGLFVGDADPTQVTVEPSEALPDGFSLSQNYPNPFNPSTQIPFTLGQPSRVTLSVFDVQGRKVKDVLVDAWRAAGQHAMRFEGTGLAGGTYLYRLTVRPEAESGRAFTESQTMTLIN